MTSFWLAAFGMGLVTFALRASLLVLPERVRLPELLRRSLRFVPAAVLTAIYAPELFLVQGAIAITPGNEKLLAGLVACAVAWHFRLTVATIVSGLAALHLFAWLI
jgi:branched-subunit amino acid transport protein